LKVVSIIPIILLLLFSLTTIRKRFGWLFAGIFSLAIISASRIMHFSTEIRSYSWRILFLTLTFFFAYEITKNQKKLRNYILLSLFSLLSLYTHYGTIFMVFAIYLFLFIYLLKNNFKNREKLISTLKNYIYSVIVSILGFSVWIPIILNQIKLGNADWLRFPTVDYFDDLFYLLFTSTENTFHIIISILFLVSFIILTVYYYFFRFDKLKVDKFLTSGLILFLTSILVTYFACFIEPV
jgi:hypothetical protein